MYPTFSHRGNPEEWPRGEERGMGGSGDPRVPLGPSSSTSLLDKNTSVKLEGLLGILEFTC